MMNSSIAQLFFGVYVRFMFELVSVWYLISYWLGQWFVPEAARGDFWRYGVLSHNKLLLRIARIKLKLHNVPPHLKRSSIIVSNHSTFMDGFIYFSLFGPDVIPVTGPAHYFPFPFGQVFIRMGAIHTARDADEESKFPESYTRKGAVARMIEVLKEGKHLIIFPEGHVERNHRLYYVHTGPARASLQTKAPVAVFGITGGEHIIGSGPRMRPGVLHVHFLRYIHPPRVSRSLPFRRAVKKMRSRIEKTFINGLPRRYLPSYIQHPAPLHTAAFFDIDNTLYKGVFIKDVVLHAMKEKVVPRRRALYALSLLLLDACRIISHEALMARSYRVIQHYSPSFIKRYARSYFNNKGVHALFEPSLSLLKNHAECGHHIVLVTESMHEIAELFARQLNATACFGTQLAVKKSRYTGDIDILLFGPEKARVVHEYAHEHHIDLDRSYAYGDSLHTDGPMLKAVGHAVAIRPSRGLAKLAKQRSWDIIRD